MLPKLLEVREAVHDETLLLPASLEVEKVTSSGEEDLLDEEV